MVRALAVAAVTVASLALSACQTTGDFYAQEPQPLVLDEYAYGALRSQAPLDPLDTKFYSSDEPVREGFRHFYGENFGLAQKHFQTAVTRTPRDATAWVGLAASYDRLRRFDLADEAYQQALALSGPTVQILNNQGYSYLLRGELKTARAKFLAAYELDPKNTTIANNLILLSTSSRMVERHPPAY